MPPAGAQARVNTTIEPAEGTTLACQCSLPLSRQTLTFAAGLLRAHLKKTGSRWRKLPPGKIALIVLAALRHDHRLAGGNGISASTISRWTWEITGPRTAPGPRPHQDQEGRRGSGAARWHPDPRPPPLRPGQRQQLQRQAQETRAAVPGPHGRIRQPGLDLASRLRTAGPGALADPGFTGLDPDPEDPVIITCRKSTRTRKTTPAQRQANQALSAARAPVEHGFSDLKNWRILTRLRMNPGKATTVLRALLVERG